MKGFYDTQFLAIRYYSKHPEVYKMADQIVDSYVSTKKRAHRVSMFMRLGNSLHLSGFIHLTGSGFQQREVIMVRRGSRFG